MQYWRLAGLKSVNCFFDNYLLNLKANFSYIQYSAVCARTLRRCLKPNAAKEAMKREESYVRVSKWQGGKLSEVVYQPSKIIKYIYSYSPSMSCLLLLFSYRNGTNVIELLSACSFIEYGYSTKKTTFLFLSK